MGLSLRGSTSGSIDINPPAVAGNNTITLPGDNGSANQFFRNSTVAGIVTYSSMVEDSSGNIGIGSETPGASLDIAKTTPVIRFTDTDAGQYSELLNSGSSFYISADRGNGGSGDIIFRSGGTSEKLRITSSGNVGIGTDNPDYKLTVADTSSYVIQNLKSSTTEFCGIYFGDTDGAGRGTIVYDNNVDAMTFRTNGSGEDLRIDSSGRLLLGTSTVSTAGDAVAARLRVSANTANSTGGAIMNLERGENAAIMSSGDLLGRIIFTGATGGDFAYIDGKVDATPSGSDFPGRLVFLTTVSGGSNPSQAMLLSNDKRFYLSNTWYNNITTANAANVHAVSNGEFYRSTSSLKYKTDVETLQDSYADAILNVRPVWYRSTCQDDNSAHSWWGFIAEEVAEIDPRLVQWKTKEVTYDDNGSAVETPCDPEPEGIAYDRFVPHLLNLIKRQKAQIETMEARLSALEGS